MKVINTLQQLVMGDRSLFPVTSVSNDKSSKVTSNEVAKTLKTLSEYNYIVSNASKLLDFTASQLIEFQKDFSEYNTSITKEGLVMRKSFFNTAELTEHTEEEAQAVLAQYAVTYGWADQYNTFTSNSAQDILDAYASTFSKEPINLSSQDATVTFALINEQQLVDDVLIPILTSKAVLRTHQIEILKNTPTKLLVNAAHVNIPIKETLILVMKLLKDEKLDFALLKTAQDVLRYIVNVYSEKQIEGQLNKSILATAHIHIPTSARKQLLNNLELIGKKRGPKFLCEDMFTYEAYWKIINKYLQYEPYAKTREKYPNYVTAIDLLYKNDRSWTFNGRYSAAKAAFDYANAFTVALERPGFVLRNLIEFMRMSKGTLLPSKQTINANDKVLTDARFLLDTDYFGSILKNKLNTKLAFQLMEQINNPVNDNPIYSRMVQGVNVNYLTPIPAIHKGMKKTVLDKLQKGISEKLNAKNSALGKIYIDPSAKDYALQYSGHSSTELSYSGEFLSKGSKIPFSDINYKDMLIRLGVMWRAKENGRTSSMDIDHSVTFKEKGHNLYREHIVYYGSPSLKINNRILAISSDDITSNGDHEGLFSTEIVDINLEEVEKAGISNFFNSFINYHGSHSIGDMECYIFMQMLDKNHQPLARERNRVTVELNKTDYAIRIDPNNTDNTGSYIGLNFDVINKQIEILALPVTTDGKFTNAKINASLFNKVIKNQVPSITLNEALTLAFDKNQITDTPEDADIIISQKPVSTMDTTVKSTCMELHPGRNAERINEFIFD